MTAGACSECGRAAHHWADREPGIKPQIHEDDEDRLAGYRRWHRQAMLRPHYVMDVDQVEYRMRNGSPMPVALLELTRIDGAPDPPPSYFAAILERARNRDAQLEVLIEISRKLQVPAYYVAFMRDGSKFYVHEIGWPGNAWTEMDRIGYSSFLARL